MTDLASAAKETFQVLLRYNYSVLLYDDQGMNVAEPSEARRMFAASPNLFVSITDADDDSSIKLMFGKSTHANDIDGLIQALRTTATKYNMTFQPRQYGKEIDAKEFKKLDSISESKGNEMNLCEGLYGTSRSSYLQLKHARMIIQHTDALDLTRPGARAQQIGAIFVECAGQRTLLPTTDLAKARALVEHVNKGGDMRGHLKAMMPKEIVVTRRTLAERNSVVQDFMAWTERFSPDHALIEGDEFLPADADAMSDDAGATSDDSDGMDAMMDDQDLGGELTREDILLPNPDQGAGLEQEVTKSVVHDDPLDPDQEHKPDQSYVSRLRALAGMRAGQTY